MRHTATAAERTKQHGNGYEHVKLDHVVESQQFTVPLLMELFDRARGMERVVARGGSLEYQHKIMATLFYEPSTRTRFSFEAAMHRLGGRVLSTEHARAFSSEIEGEQVEDSIRIVGSYSDVIVIRHHDEGGAPDGRRGRLQREPEREHAAHEEQRGRELDGEVARRDADTAAAAAAAQHRVREHRHVVVPADRRLAAHARRSRPHDRAAQGHTRGDDAEEAAQCEPGHEDEREDEVHRFLIDIRAAPLESGLRGGSRGGAVTSWRHGAAGRAG